jgi:hypothetical protein
MLGFFVCGLLEEAHHELELVLGHGHRLRRVGLLAFAFGQASASGAV